MRLTALKTLDLGGVSKLSQEALAKLVRKTTTLTELNLTRCLLVGSDLCWNLAPRVETLGDGEDEEQVQEPVGSGACESWEDIDMDAPMHRTLGLPSLRALSLAKCPLVTDSGLSRVSLCLALQQLDVSDCELVCLCFVHSCARERRGCLCRS